MRRDTRVIVGGFLGLFPAGGVTWDYIQYPLGFSELGCDVFYIEDTRLWPIFQTDSQDCVNCSVNVAHLASVMDSFGLSKRWAYRDEVSGECFGLSQDQVAEVCRTADIFINISCSTFLRDEYHSIPVRVLIDSDPMFTQIQYETQLMFTEGQPTIRGLVEAHTHHFTFGLNVGSADCRIPTSGIDWKPTLQPTCLSHWPASDLPAWHDSAYTTVMNWAVAPPVEFNGESWGQKNVEMERLMALPEAVPEIPLAVVVAQTTGEPFPASNARRRGWKVFAPESCVPDWKTYRSFIQQSRGEFSVAKETYVKARTGWFSCRSACYLASGRAVVAQDTGWSKYLPNDRGLLPFSDQESAVEALRRIEEDPVGHARAARQIAETFLDSRLVLGDLLRELGA